AAGEQQSGLDGTGPRSVEVTDRVVAIANPFGDRCRTSVPGRRGGYHAKAGDQHQACGQAGADRGGGEGRGREVRHGLHPAANGVGNVDEPTAAFPTPASPATAATASRMAITWRDGRFPGRLVCA